MLLAEKPDLAIVFGDTNSTLAGALAAVKLHIPVAHVEAVLRSFDCRMPEEINRLVTDHISDLLFCPTETAVRNLANEGIMKGVHLVGDVMVDALDYNKGIAENKSRVLERFKLSRKGYLVVTVHRPANTDNRKNMEAILSALGDSGLPVLFPVHPRTKKMLKEYGHWDHLPGNVIVTEPLGYLDMLQAMAHARKILTDSGSVQKEAYLPGVPCITLRDTTEWVETVGDGWNVLVGADQKKNTGMHIFSTIPVRPEGSLRERREPEDCGKNTQQFLRILFSWGNVQNPRPVDIRFKFLRIAEESGLRFLLHQVSGYQPTEPSLQQGTRRNGYLHEGI